MTSLVVKSLYEFESSDNKVLSFGIDERFIVIKQTNPTDWLYVVNQKGRLGYIPANYVNDINLNEEGLLNFIDSVAGHLDTKNNDSLAITDRQVKHAQIKLAQMRCEVVQKLFKRTHPETIKEEEKDPDCDVISSVKNDLKETKEVTKETKEADKRLDVEEVINKLPNSFDKLENSKKNKTEDVKVEVNKISQENSNIKSNNKSTKPNDQSVVSSSGQTNSHVKIPDVLIPELIERVRICTDLSHSMCTLAVKTVIQCLGEMIPQWDSQCQMIIEKLINDDTNGTNLSNSGLKNVQSYDLINLKAVFKKLWCCKNDEQQRSWPVHQDEDLIKGFLEEILQILTNANVAHIRDVIFKNNYENVNMLVTYFQMEVRRSLRMKLFSIFICLMTLFENLIPDYFLTSVLPSELAVEMQNYVSDEERWSAAALLFTAIFSTGHKPPINIYEHINENFIAKQLDIIEGIDSDGNKINCRISLESSIAPILSFNIHFDDPKTNIVLQALRKRPNASQFTENLVSYLNWEEDITKINGLLKDSNGDSSKLNPTLKLLIEMFGDPIVSKLFYYNDVRVVIDIIIRQLNNLPAGDKARAAYLLLALNVVKNTSYSEEPHKLKEFSKSLKSIEEHESSTEKDRNLVKLIYKEQPLLNCDC